MIVSDVECYRNYFLVAFKDYSSKRTAYFEMLNDEVTEGSIDLPMLARIMARKTIHGFNYINYDLPMVYAAIAGFSCSQLKDISDTIIGKGRKYWQICRDFNFNIPKGVDIIDVMEVAPGVGSLKIYAGRLGAKWMQDLPFHHTRTLSHSEAAFVKQYCFNDLDNTHALAEHLKDRIELRVRMSQTYGIDLRSKSDAQIAEAVIKHEVEKITRRVMQRPKIPAGTTFKYKPPKYLKFRSKVMRDAFEIVKNAIFTVDYKGVNGEKSRILIPEAMQDLLINIGKSEYKLQIGGLHSREKHISHYATSRKKIRDADVGSYYPNIIVKNGFFPASIGKAFFDAYSLILSTRLAAKAAKDKITDAVLKIVLNSSFGKFGSMWSTLFAPDLMIQVTLTGQLSLLMLIEQLEHAGISVISANTDGIVSEIPVELEDKYNEICKQWENDTQYNLEFVDYASIHNSSVNSYIAFKTDGGVKLKGDFTDNTLCYEPNNGIGTNPDAQIAVEAAVKFLSEGTPIEDTIRDCTNIDRFVTVTKVKGGANDANGELVGEVVRWYNSTDHVGPLRRVTNGNTVPVSQRAKPMMTKLDTLPDDIDYEWYIGKSYSILQDIGYKKSKYIGDLI